jgi:hypothetical protein
VGAQTSVLRGRPGVAQAAVRDADDARQGET